jgi:NAD(P)H dehydrogenase (quinone)
MGNILVLYDSSSGNTRKMAEYVFQGANSTGRNNVKLLFIDQATAEDIKWCDGIAVGSPTNMGLLSWKMKKFWDDCGKELWGKIDGKIGCAFSAEGGWGGGAEITCMSILIVLVNYGFLVFGATDYVAEKYTLHYGATNPGPPDSQAAKDACMRIGIKLDTWVDKYFNNKTL